MLNTPKGYTDIDAIEAYLLIDIAQYFEPTVLDWIASVEAIIDTATNRYSFIADSTATPRYFDGTYGPSLGIDDAVEITSISLGTGQDATIYLPASYRTDYLLYPLQQGTSRAPYDRISLLTDRFPRGEQNIIVTAKWGYSLKVPADIKLAATMMVSDIIEESMAAEGEVQSMSIGRYSVSYKDMTRWQDNNEIKNVIERYRVYKNF